MFSKHSASSDRISPRDGLGRSEAKHQDSIDKLVSDIVENNRKISILLGKVPPQNQKHLSSLLSEFDASLETNRLLDKLLNEEAPYTNTGQKDNKGSPIELEKRKSPLK